MTQSEKVSQNSWHMAPFKLGSHKCKVYGLLKPYGLKAYWGPEV
jgi:hypothetical protein